MPVLLALQTAPGRSGELTRVAALYFACSGVYFLMGVIFFVFWRWLRRDLPMLALSVLCGVMGLHSAGISGTLAIVFPGAIDAQASALIGVLSYVLLSGLIACMLWAFFPHAFYPRASSSTHVVNTTLAALAIFVSGLLAGGALVMDYAEPILAASRWATAALMLVAAVLASRTLRSRVENRVVTIVGLGLLVAGSLFDLFFARLGEAGYAYLVPFALLGFVLLQSYVMIRRTAEATLRAQVSGKRLRREVDARTKELQAATEAAQNANLAKTDFVTAVTHELRTPLASMLGYVRLLRDELRSGLSTDQSEFFDTLEESGERLLNLVNKLLDLARIESGHIDLTLEPVNAADVLDQVRNELYPLANEKKLFLKQEIEADDTTVLADEQWLSVVLSDLVSNAIKYTREGGVTMRIMRSMRGSEPAVAVKIIDTGTGISAEFMPRLFERFSREEHARTGSPTGTGLGLTITREVLSLMNGDVFVESKLGTGSEFTVLLPAAGPREDLDGAAVEVSSGDLEAADEVSVADDKPAVDDQPEADDVSAADDVRSDGGA